VWWYRRDGEWSGGGFRLHEVPFKLLEAISIEAVILHECNNGRSPMGFSSEYNHMCNHVTLLGAVQNYDRVVIMQSWVHSPSLVGAIPWQAHKRSTFGLYST